MALINESSTLNNDIISLLNTTFTRVNYHYDSRRIYISRDRYGAAPSECDSHYPRNMVRMNYSTLDSSGIREPISCTIFTQTEESRITTPFNHSYLEEQSTRDQEYISRLLNYVNTKAAELETYITTHADTMCRLSDIEELEPINDIHENGSFVLQQLRRSRTQINNGKLELNN